MVAFRQFPERFQVAISFAGAQRETVRAVAEELERALGTGSVFFDEWFEHVIAGDDADLSLQNVYHDRAELVIVCVSGEYNDRPWTNLEHRAIRALTMSGERLGKTRGRIFPIRVGEGDVDGIYANAIVPDVRDRSPKMISELIVARLHHVRRVGTEAVQVPGSQPVDTATPVVHHAGGTEFQPARGFKP